MDPVNIIVGFDQKEAIAYHAAWARASEGLERSGETGGARPLCP